MDAFPDISMPVEVKEDLEIIETEDLKSDPFIRQPPIKPPAPTPQKPKRQVSEKQKAHLANARKLAKERKLAKKKEDEQEKKQDIKEYATPITVDTKNTKTDMGTTSSVGTPKVDGFEQFLGYMDKYGDMMVTLQKQEAKKREEEERKEKELEAKYFKKFQEQNKPVTQVTEEKVKKIPQKHLDILNPPKTDYGEYGSYF